MKTLILLICLLAVGSVSAFDNAIFGGIRYEEDTEWIPMTGYAKHIGGWFWSITYIDLGSYENESMSTDLALVKGISSRLTFGILAGADLTTNRAFTDYLVLAGGFLGSYEIRKDFGLWGTWKYKYNPDRSVTFKEKSIFAGGIFIGI